MSTHSIERTEVITHARKARLKGQLADLDYKRDVRALASLLSQHELAREIGVSQPAISKTLKQAADLPQVPEGFSGATPLEICERYAAGEIDRDQLIKELGEWDYPPRDTTDGYDTILVDPIGSFGDVELAHLRGLIDDAIYDAVLDLVTDSPS
ncbi:hypothetical protein ACLM5J_19815 [Nocardioides sp. Bht2]|uniref:hypothetical protein n=1 Tax=Nocardioides sp. Bht2 TaxID=3392297 RepID=UPI0039B3D93E